MARRRVAAMLVGAAALAAPMAGCGGGEESPATAGDGAEGPTKAQYVKRATAICEKHRAQIAGELAPIGARLRQGKAVDRAEIEEAMEGTILPAFRSEYEELRRLRPPRGEEDFLDLLLSKFSRALENGEESLARFFRIKLSAYSEFAEGSLMTQEFGIRGCGSPRRSPRAVVRAYALSGEPPGDR
jgi:hypothetical protein